MPADALARHGADVAMLGRVEATPALLAALHEVAGRNAELVALGGALSPQVVERRLRLETAVIGRLAAKLNGWLLLRDPLSQPVHLSKPAALWQAILGAAGSLVRPAVRPSGARSSLGGRA